MWRRVVGVLVTALVVVGVPVPAVAVAPSTPTVSSVSGCLQECVPVAVGTLTPTFTGVATDPDSASLTYKLELRLRGSTTVISSVTGSTAAPGVPGTVTVPGGVLADATEYEYRFGAADATATRWTSWTAVQTVVGPDVPVVVRALSVSSEVTLGTEGSPYVLRGLVNVGPGGVLSVEPGTVIKAGSGGSIAVQGGQIVADGTSANPIYMTSLADDSVGGDSGADGPTTGAAGDYTKILAVQPTLDQAAEAPTSVIDNVSFRYGGGGYQCLTAAMVEANGEARVAITHSEFLDYNAGGLGINGAGAGIGTVLVERSLFDGSDCAINATGSRATIRANVMADPNERALFFWASGRPAYGTWVQDNHFYGEVSINSNEVPTREDINFLHNEFVTGVNDVGGAVKDHEDLANNYWLFSPNHVDPVNCVPPGHPSSSNPVMIPEVKTRINTSCPTNYEVYDDFTKIRPFSGPPPALPVGLNGDPFVPITVQPGQSLGLGDGRFAVNPTGFQSDPVNTANGSYVEQTVDATMPVLGEDLLLGRTYNSADATTGPLGRGWSSSLTTRLSFPDPDTIVLTGEDGQQSMFIADGSDWVAAPGVTAVLTENGSGAFEVATRSGVTYNFTAAGRLSATEDEHGHGWDFDYDGSGDLESVGSGTRDFEVAWTGNRITRVDLPDGRWVGYTYTGGLLTGVRDLAGETTTYAYDGADRLESKTDQTGEEVIRLDYDNATGRVSDQWDAEDHHTTFAWNPTTTTATMVDPEGGDWVDVYTDGVLTKRVDPLNRTWRYEYNPDLQMVAATDPRGFRSRFVYDKGDLVATTTPRGTVLAEFDNDHNPTKTTDARGFSTVNTYNGTGDLTETVRYGKTGQTPRTTTFDYTPAGLLEETTDPDGVTTEYTYNGHGDLLTVTGPGGETSYGYDSTGRVEWSQPRPGDASPDEFRTSYDYDDADRLVGVTDPLDRTATTTYDEAGHPLTAEDFAGRTTNYTHTPTGRVETVQGPDTSLDPTEFEYDDNGNTTKVTDPSGRVETTSYDAANQATSITTPIGTTTYVYDRGGNPTSITRPGSITTTYSYDAADRIRKIDYPTGTTDVAFAYDVAGNRTTMTQGSRTVAYTYDGFNQLLSAKVGAATPYAYSYSTGGRIQTVTPPVGPATTLGYDSAGRLDEVIVNSQTRAAYTYTPTGQVETATLGDGSTRDYDYDAADRLVRLTDETGSRTILDDQIVYDDADNPIEVTHDDASVDSYTYDVLDRLTGVCYDTATCDGTAIDYVRWTYDPVGNRTSEVRPAGTTTYTRNTSSGQLSSTSGLGGSTSYTYNTRGELTGRTKSGTSTSYTYDAAGRLTNQTTGTTDTNYSYDGDGRRLTTAVTTTGSGTVTTCYQWDPQTYQLAAETNGSGAATKTYTQGLEPLTETDVATSAVSFLHADRQGSIRETTNTSGTALTTAEYEPYGIPRPGTTAVAGIGWAGEYTDATGETHLRARQYDPTIGSFSVPDPANTTDPGATYGYADANPMTNADPLGLWSENSDSWGGLGYIAENVIGLTPLGDIYYAFGRCPAEKGSCGTEMVLSTLTAATGGAASLGAYRSIRGVRGAGSASHIEDIAEGVGDTCRINSFTGDTLVLMADGSKKQIQDVKLGDRVMATDPITGRQGGRKVTDLILGEGLKDLVRVGTDPDGDGAMDWVIATDGHPFWVSGRGWIDAADLELGDLLVSNDGRPIEVTRLSETTRVAVVHNLTVDRLHTYYVLTGDEPVLVHNSCRPPIRVPTGSKNSAYQQAGQWMKRLKEQGYACKIRKPCSLDYAHVEWERGRGSGTIHFGPPFRPGRR